MKGIICGTGSAVPVGIVNNQDLTKLVETNDEWIRECTGIVRRHVAGSETTVSLAAEAAKRALADAKADAEEIDLIIVSTISSNVILPCTACEVQKEIGAVNAFCFDLNAACTGFVLAYQTACAYLASGHCRAALVIGSECLSKLINWQDRGTCILFGDGAGAVVIRADEGQLYFPVVHSDGARGDALTCASRYDGRYQTKIAELLHQKKNTDELFSETSYFMQMDGQTVFKFAVRSVPEVINEVLEKNHLQKEEIDWFLLHQANRRIVEAVAKRMEEPIEKFPMNLQEYGNTSSASIPLLLNEMNQKGMLESGQKIVLAGFGAGLTWGASILEWK